MYYLPLNDQSEWSLRLFPGHPAVRAYCIDFVKDDTHEPVDAPFGQYDLYALPSRAGYALAMEGPLQTFEANMGIPEDERRPGEQKYIVIDGTRCRLYGPSLRKPVEFVVPSRPDCDEDEEPEDVDVRVLG